MLEFKALHVLSMFAAMVFLVGESTLFAVAVWRSDVRGLAAMSRLAGRRPVIGSLIFLVAIVFGFLTALTGHFDLLAGWLIAAYVMVVAALAISASPVVQKGFLGLVDRAVEADAGRRPAEEVAQEMSTFRGRFASVVIANAVLFAAIILDMIYKPF
jgi:hypothetical protein